MPTLIAMPWPSGPVVASTPETRWYSGWPGALLPNCRKWRISSSVTDGLPTVSYSAFTACVPVRCSTDHSNIDAWPLESTKRSRFGQIGSFGSKRITRFHSVYTSGASAIGVPGWPELAACTASIDSVRIVLMQRVSISCVAATSASVESQCSPAAAAASARITARSLFTRPAGIERSPLARRASMVTFSDPVTTHSTQRARSSTGNVSVMRR